MIDTTVAEAREILDVAIGHGVRHFVLSPGSRNAPLLIAAAARHDIKRYVVADERTAGFIGLGLASILGRPVALICTSGTALLNYAPAVAEAYYRRVPLVVISADRPEEWIDQDDSQTLRQFEALRNFVKNSYDLEASGLDEIPASGLANRLANDAMLTALTPPEGPVHINLRLPEPLGRRRVELARTPRVITGVTAPAELPRTEIKRLGEELRDKRIMIVCGFMNPDHKMNRALKELSEIPNVAILAESIANFSEGTDTHLIDLPLSAEFTDCREVLQPDFVISVGGALVSRKLKEFLRSSGAEHWGVGHFRTTVDCFRSLSKRIEVDAAPFLRGLASILRGQASESTPRFAAEWEKVRKASVQRRDRLVASAPWCELKVFSILAERLSSRVNLHLSNGTSVRYGQLFDFAVHGTWCNRGVSGIDGSTSTAIGAALAYSGPTVLVTGDMSFSYDLGALASRLAPDTFKIIVINNGGGAIFRFIGSTGSLDPETRETYFCADSTPPVRELAEAYGWAYSRAASEEELTRVIDPFVDFPGKAILEITVPPETGAVELKRLLDERSGA